MGGGEGLGVAAAKLKIIFSASPVNCSRGTPARKDAVAFRGSACPQKPLFRAQRVKQCFLTLMSFYFFSIFPHYKHNVYSL